MTDENGWHPFGKYSMPKTFDSVLVWLDYRKSGFPVTAFVEPGGRLMYWNSSGKRYVENLRTCRWKEIEPPEGEYRDG